MRVARDGVDVVRRELGNAKLTTFWPSHSEEGFRQRP